MNKKVTSIQTAAVSVNPTPKPQPNIEGYLRLNQILGDKDHPPILPIGKTTWYAWVKSGKAPKGVLLGAKTRAYRVEEIRALIESLSGAA